MVSGMAARAALLLAVSAGLLVLFRRPDPPRAPDACVSLLGARPVPALAAAFGPRPELSVRGDVLRLRTLARPARPYTLQLGLRTSAPVRKGDALLARFQVRSAGFSPRARTEFVFERAGGDHAKSVLFPVEAGPLWRSVDVAFAAGDDFAAGQAKAHFNLGFNPQTLELAAVELLGCGGPQALAGLPATPLSYEGRSRYAPWRWRAERRIERLRKTDIRLRVVDAQGRAVPGARLRLSQRRQAFAFGSAVDDKFLLGKSGADQRRYAEAIPRLFNTAVLENALKWRSWRGSRRAQARQALELLRAQGLDARGHALVWPAWKHLPAELRRLEGDPAALRLKIKEHILEEASDLRDLVSEWDVLNEPRESTDLALLGRNKEADWLRWTRQADPVARLYVNEYGLIDQEADAASLDDFAALARRLSAAGAPLGGLGLQAHFDRRLTPPVKVLSILDRLQPLGLPLKVTELDIDLSDERLQADYLRDLLTAVFSHPAAEGVLLWGFWQGLEPQAVLYRKDWSLTPAGEVWEELVLRRWRTDAEGVSDSRGEFQVRGFLGSYAAEASRGSARGRVEFQAAPGGVGAVIRLSPTSAARSSDPALPGR